MMPQPMFVTCMVVTLVEIRERKEPFGRRIRQEVWVHPEDAQNSERGRDEVHPAIVVEASPLQQG